MRETLGVVLAGGKSTRMGGHPKAEVELGGQRLLDRVLDRLEPQVDAAIVNANDATQAAVPIVPDRLHGRLGPLAGIAAALTYAHENGYGKVVSVAVDTPFFPCDLVPHLILAAQSSDHGLAVASCGQNLHGAFGLWPESILPAMLGFLERGGRKVRDFTAQQGAALAAFPETTPDAFFNINTPADLEKAAQWV